MILIKSGKNIPSIYPDGEVAFSRLLPSARYLQDSAASTNGSFPIPLYSTSNVSIRILLPFTISPSAASEMLWLSLRLFYTLTLHLLPPTSFVALGPLRAEALYAKGRANVGATCFRQNNNFVMLFF